MFNKIHVRFISLKFSNKLIIKQDEFRPLKFDHLSNFNFKIQM